MRKVFLTSAIAALAALFAAATVAAEETKITITKKDCRKITRYTPPAGVTYQPGVDARGRRVAPADIGGGVKWKVPETVTIDIGIDLEEKYGLGTGGKYTGEAKVAEVKVNTKTGLVTLDGEPLTDPDQDALAAACRSILKGGK